MSKLNPLYTVTLPFQWKGLSKSSVDNGPLQTSSKSSNTILTNL